MSEAVKLFFATGNGNSRRLSNTLHEGLGSLAIPSKLHNLANHTVTDLEQALLAVFFISTWGEGDPPPDAEAFFQSVADYTGRLDHLQYAMVGLGDSCFRHFCGASVTLDAHLQGLGARPIMPLKKLDAYFAPCVRDWQHHFFQQLQADSQIARIIRAA